MTEFYAKYTVFIIFAFHLVISEKDHNREMMPQVVTETDWNWVPMSGSMPTALRKSFCIRSVLILPVVITTCETCA